MDENLSRLKDQIGHCSGARQRDHSRGFDNIEDEEQDNGGEQTFQKGEVVLFYSLAAVPGFEQSGAGGLKALAALFRSSELEHHPGDTQDQTEYRTDAAQYGGGHGVSTEKLHGHQVG